MICEATGLYVPNPELGTFSVFPNLSGGLASFAPISPTSLFLQLDFSHVMSLNFFAVIFAFLFVDTFDTLGTLIGVAAKSDMLDEEATCPTSKAP